MAINNRSIFISISLNSNRPKEFGELLDNLEQTAYDPSRIEVLVRIDDGDEPMQDFVRREQKRRDLQLKFLSLPYTGYFNLALSLNLMHSTLCAPESYFVQHYNDEVRYKTLHWDKILEERYTGLFSDHIYRLRLSLHKLWNYYVIDEVGPHPENIPIVTKKWIDLTGWCACYSVDTFQQLLVYYLARSDNNHLYRVHRDIPVLDIELDGLEAGVELETEAERTAKGRKSHREEVEESWGILLSEAMQLEAQKKANILRAYVKVSEMGKGTKDIRITHDQHATHVFETVTGKEILTFYFMSPTPRKGCNLNLGLQANQRIVSYARRLSRKYISFVQKF